MASISSISGSSAFLSQISQRIFNKVDTDKSGGISKDEFDDVFAKTPVGKAGGDADTRFARLDNDGDGKLSQEEVTIGIRRMLAAMHSSKSSWDPMQAFEESESNGSSV